MALVSIENYYCLSEILKSDIITLNNEIAEYLHSAVYRYGGNGVMNYEGSFLVTFEVPSNMEHQLEREEKSVDKN